MNTNSFPLRPVRPRFGLVQSVVAASAIKRGEEIFAHYGYPYDGDFTPQWYKDFYLRYYGEERARAKVAEGKKCFV